MMDNEIRSNNFVIDMDPNTNLTGRIPTFGSCNSIACTVTPLHAAFDSLDRNIYVTNDRSADNVTVINGTSNLLIQPPIAVGHVPTGIAYDSANGELFVTNTGDGSSFGNTVSVIKRTASPPPPPPPPPPPTVTSTIPADHATGVPITTSVNATFNEPLKLSTINNKTFTLSPASCEFSCARPATVSLSQDGMTAILRPTSSLAASDLYNAAISTDVQSSSGINMTLPPKTWSFTTSAPPPQHATSLILNPMSSPNSGTTSVTAVGNLIDTTTNTGVSGKTISFTGTGGGVLASAKTGGVNFTDPSGSVNVGPCSTCTVGGNVLKLNVGASIILPAGNSGVTLLTGVNSVNTAVHFTYTVTFADGSPPATRNSDTTGDTPIPNVSIKKITITSVNQQPTGSVGISGLKLLRANAITTTTDAPGVIATIGFSNSGTFPATSANPFTVSQGLFFSIGRASSTIQTGLGVTAQFSALGDSAYLPSTSNAQTYDVIAVLHCHPQGPLVKQLL